MKFTAIWGILLIQVSGYTYGQPCPGDSVIFNASTLPDLVLPTGDTVGTQIVIGSGTSAYITTSPNTTTNVSALNPPDFVVAAIVFTQNFHTDIGTSGVFTASIGSCGKIGVSTPASASAGLLPASKLQIYPTVSTGSITITGSAATLANSIIQVFDETGRIVYSLYNEAGTTLYLNLGNLANGLYFLQIRQPAKTTTQKIIINK